MSEVNLNVVKAGDLCFRHLGRTIILKTEDMAVRGTLRGVEHGGLLHDHRVKLSIGLPSGGHTWPDVGPQTGVEFV